MSKPPCDRGVRVHSMKRTLVMTAAIARGRMHPGVADPLGAAEPGDNSGDRVLEPPRAESAVDPVAVEHAARLLMSGTVEAPLDAASEENPALHRQIAPPHVDMARPGPDIDDAAQIHVNGSGREVDLELRQPLYRLEVPRPSAVVCPDHRPQPGRRSRRRGWSGCSSRRSRS